MKVTKWRSRVTSSGPSRSACSATRRSRALLDEAATLFLNGEADAARLAWRDLVNATVGFETLATETAKPAKSLYRMLSRNGNPTMDNLAAILGVVRRSLGVELRARTVEAA